MELLTVKETAEILRIKIGTLYTWVHHKKILYVKIGRNLCFKYEDIEAFILNNRHGGQGYIG